MTAQGFPGATASGTAGLEGRGDRVDVSGAELDQVREETGERGQAPAHRRGLSSLFPRACSVPRPLPLPVAAEARCRWAEKEGPGEVPPLAAALQVCRSAGKQLSGKPSQPLGSTHAAAAPRRLAQASRSGALPPRSARCFSSG